MIDPPPFPAHLLVGVDFSEGARAALDEARRLADRMLAALLIVHVYEPQEAEALALDPLAEEWLADADLTRDRIELRYGRPWVELARAASASGAVAVVVGSHGRSGFQPLALGSTVGRLGLIAPCPVIVVNPQARSRAAHRPPAAREPTSTTP